MQGHRQNFVEVHINEIVVDGKSFKADSLSPKPRQKRSPRKRPPRRLRPQRNSRKGTRLRVPN